MDIQIAMQSRIKSVTKAKIFYAFLELFSEYDGILRFMMYSYALRKRRDRYFLRFMMYSYAFT